VQVFDAHFAGQGGEEFRQRVWWEVDQSVDIEEDDDGGQNQSRSELRLEEATFGAQFAVRSAVYCCEGLFAVAE
jgi:hypothetical protein